MEEGGFFPFSQLLLGAGCVDSKVGKEQVRHLRDFPCFLLVFPLFFPPQEPREHRKLGLSFSSFPGLLLPPLEVLGGLRWPEVTRSLNTFEDVGQSHAV